MSESDEAVISVVPGRCIGAGNCVEQADDYFDQDDDTALVVLLRDRVPATDRPRVQRAANVCPVAALLLRDA